MPSTVCTGVTKRGKACRNMTSSPCGKCHCHREGVVREHAFGQVDDLALGVLVGSLVAAPATMLTEVKVTADGCDDAGCQVAAAVP